MKNILNNLANWLNSNYFFKVSQEIKDLSNLDEYAEPWHQEAVEELNNKDQKDLKELEDKYILNEKELKEDINNYLIKSFDYIEISVSEINEILKNEGFNAIFQSESIVAGKGAFGLVLKGTYQGKPAVVKVEVNDVDYPEEVNNWMIILKSKETMPEKYKKHIPNIFKLNVGKYEKEGRTPLYYSVIIMEELLKLPADMLDLLNGGISAINHTKELLKDQDFTDSIASKLLGSIKLKTIKHQAEYDIIYPTIERISYLLGYYEPFSSDESIAKTIAQEIISVNKKTKEKNDRIWMNHCNNLINTINHSIKYFLSSYYFPTNHEIYNNDSVWSAFPETKTFFETLSYLKYNNKLSWRDLHFKNIMMGKDGNLKIIDVGLYERDLE